MTRRRRNLHERSNRRPDRTFTMVELLVVAVVLLVLMGMLLPALNRARGKAQQAHCINRIKQIGNAVAFYVENYEGFFPLDEDRITEPETLWTHRILDILGENVKFFNDPGMPADTVFVAPSGSHYMFNADLNARDGNTVSMRMVNVLATARTMMIFGGSNLKRFGSVPELLTGDLIFPHPAVGIKSNILFVDGHNEVRAENDVPRVDTDRFWAAD